MNSDIQIPFIRPALPTSEELVSDYEQIHINNFYSNNGPFYYDFANTIENYFDSSVHCSILANATLGLILSLKTTAIAGRKYVITPSFTFAATALSSLWAGFEPYFVDIERDTFQMDISQTRHILENNHDDVAAIMLCNPFGIGLKNISDFEKLSEMFDVPLVIDSAAGFGSLYNDTEKVGTKGTCEVFSLHITKPFGISEGGIVCARDKDIIDSIETFKNFGFNPLRSVESIGLNAKITEINCAIGLRMLPLLDGRIAKRQSIFQHYMDATQKYGITFVDNADNSALCFASLILPEGWSKYDLMAKYEQANIEVRDYYNPLLHDLDAFKKFSRLDMNVTNDYSHRMISLPNSELLSEDDIFRIISVIDRYAQEM